MDQTLQQVGELLLGAIPTAVIVILLYGIYTVLLRRPMNRVLEERRERTEGAMQKARSDIGEAESKTQEYEQALREARAAIYKAQEERRQRALQARMEALTEARNRAQQQIEVARAAMENDMAATRSSLQNDANELASRIIATILKSANPAPVGGKL